MNIGLYGSSKERGTHLMEVIKLFWFNDASNQCAAFEMFSGTKAHGYNVHVAGVPSSG